MKRFTKTILTALILLLLSLALYFGYRFLYAMHMYHKDTVTYDTLKDTYTKDEPEGDTESGPEEDAKSDAVSDKKQDTEPVAKAIDWNGLLSANPDICAWIVMSPDIDYPVVQGETNDSYLHTDVNGGYSFGGCIFVNCTSAADFSDRNTIIFGHNMKNGSMFGNLDYYYDSSYAQENPYIYLYLPDGTRRTYRIARDLITQDASCVYTAGIRDSETFSQYLSDTSGYVNYELASISKDDSIISLSTCVYAEGTERHVIQAVLQE